MFTHPSVILLNHLLAQNNWALPRLSNFSGKSVRFDIAPFSFSCTILADGSLQGVDSTIRADALCVIPLWLLPRLALHDELAHNKIRSEGDTALLTEIFFLSRNLRWDTAADMSKVTGDIVAERFVQTLRSANQQLLDSVAGLSQSAAEYLTEERPLLAKPRHVSAFMRQVDNLRDDLARLEQRINRLPADSEN